MDPHGYTSGFSRNGHLLLMRHPQTVANEGHYYLGQLNAPLTELGVEQCARAIAGIISWKPDRIITSPLDRCRAIAEPAASELSCPITVDDRIGELDFGPIEGKSTAEIYEAGLPLPWGDHADDWPVEGAESMEHFRARLAEAASSFVALDGRTAIVSHGGSIRGMLSYWLSVPGQHMWQITLANVHSALVSVEDHETVYLERLGLSPEQLGEFV